jgi:hypothetical protein
MNIDRRDHILTIFLSIHTNIDLLSINCVLLHTEKIIYIKLTYEQSKINKYKSLHISLYKEGRDRIDKRKGKETQMLKIIAKKKASRSNHSL